MACRRDSGKKAPVLVLLALPAHSWFRKDRASGRPSDGTGSGTTPVEVVEGNVRGGIRRGQRSLHRPRGRGFKR